MGHQGAGPGQLLGRVLDAHLGAALDPVQDRVLEGRLLELARLREEARRAGKHDGEPLPALFVILDEFSELLSDKPDFIEVFVAIGRLGRSMQIHLLLSSQRLEECRLHGLESHLSYRIGLRTFSAAESRIVLGVADAYDLPPYPGSGYLKSGTREMTRFRACYVAGQPPERVNAALAPAPTGEPRERVVTPRVVPFSARPVHDRTAPPPVEEDVDVVDVGDAVDARAAESEPSAPPPAQDIQYAEMTTMDIAVARMAGHGTPAHQIWLPPLNVSETFDSLLGDLVVDPELGLVSPSWRARGDLEVPLGITDVPLEQRREYYSVDLSGAGGHVAVIGGPLSGKSTALRSLVMGLALTRTPVEVQVYVIDLGGGTFSTMLDLPHLAGVATRDEPDVVARIMAEVSALLDDRGARPGPRRQRRLSCDRGGVDRSAGAQAASAAHAHRPGDASGAGAAGRRPGHRDQRGAPGARAPRHEPRPALHRPGHAKTGRRRQSRHVRTDHPDAERLVDTRHHAARKSRRGAAARAAEAHS